MDEQREAKRGRRRRNSSGEEFIGYGTTGAVPAEADVMEAEKAIGFPAADLAAALEASGDVQPLGNAEIGDEQTGVDVEGAARGSGSRSQYVFA